MVLGSRVWGSLLVMTSGCAGGRGFGKFFVLPGKVFSPEITGVQVFLYECLTATRFVLLLPFTSVGRLFTVKMLQFIDKQGIFG